MSISEEIFSECQSKYDTCPNRGKKECRDCERHLSIKWMCDEWNEISPTLKEKLDKFFKGDAR